MARGQIWTPIHNPVDLWSPVSGADSLLGARIAGDLRDRALIATLTLLI